MDEMEDSSTMALLHPSWGFDVAETVKADITKSDAPPMQSACAHHLEYCENENQHVVCAFPPDRCDVRT